MAGTSTILNWVGRNIPDESGEAGWDHPPRILWSSDIPSSDRDLKANERYSHEACISASVADNDPSTDDLILQKVEVPVLVGNLPSDLSGSEEEMWTAGRAVLYCKKTLPPPPPLLRIFAICKCFFRMESLDATGMRLNRRKVYQNYFWLDRSNHSSQKHWELLKEGYLAVKVKNTAKNTPPSVTDPRFASTEKLSQGWIDRPLSIPNFFLAERWETEICRRQWLLNRLEKSKVIARILRQRGFINKKVNFLNYLWNIFLVPSVMKVQRLFELLQKDGWYAVSQKGSHIKMRHLQGDPYSS